MAKNVAGFLYGELADFGDGFAGDADGAGLGTQAGATALRAQCVTPITAQEHADVELVFLAFEIIEEPFDAAEIAGGIAFEEQAALVGSEMAPGDVGGNTLSAREFLGFLEQDAVAGLGPRLDGAVVERLAGIGDDEIEIEVDRVPEALAAWACAVRVVEREKPRLGLLIDDAVVLALEAVVEDQTLGGIACGVGNKFEDGFAVTFAVADFDGINQARARLGIDGKPIDNDPHGLRIIDLEKCFGRGKFVQSAVLIEPVESALLDIAEGLAQGVLIRRGVLFLSQAAA